VPKCMRLVLAVGVGGVFASLCVYSRISATSTCRSITAYISRVGLQVSGSRFTMLASLMCMAATAFYTLLETFISSTLSMFMKFLDYG
jgi:hypothetical protein